MQKLVQNAFQIEISDSFQIKIRELLFEILLFFFIWDVNFSFLPFTSNVHIAVLGVLFFPFTFKWKIYREDIIPICLYLAMLLYASFVLFVHHTSDYVFIYDELIRHIAVPFFGAWFVAYVGKDVVNTKEDLLNLIIKVNLLQSLFIMLEFSVPAFKKCILALQVLTTGGVGQMVEAGIRAYGLGAGYDIGAFVMSFSLLFTIYLYFEESRKKNKIKYLLYYTIQALSGLLMARSIAFGCVVSVLFFLSISGPNTSKKKRKIIIALIGAIIVGLIIFKIFYNKINSILQEHSQTVTWIFEFFTWDKVKATGKKTNSLITLSGMYLLPDSLGVWLFGEGRYVAVSGNPYRDMDPFYMRFLYFWGVPGMLLYLTFLKKLINNVKMKYRRCIFSNEGKINERLFSKLLLFIFIMCLVIDIKLIAHCFGMLFLLVFYFYFKENANKNINWLILRRANNAEKISERNNAKLG